MPIVFKNLKEGDMGVLVQEIISYAQKGRNIVMLFGDLGVGKTTLVRAIYQVLLDSDAVCSPSFGLVHDYSHPDGTLALTHLDLYRLSSIDEFWNIGGSEILQNSHLVCMEWPQVLEGWIDEASCLSVVISEGSHEHLRDVELSEGYGDTGSYLKR
jgi:tRNA threonylcarbamoyladenosine biosynthesis protein TsaE